MAVTWTDDEIASIKAGILAIAAGERIVVVQFADRQVTYQAADIDKLQALLATAEATSGDSGSRLASFSKGLD